MALEVIVLAAGQGTRMRSTLPKVLHQLGGVPLLQHVLNTVAILDPDKVHIVYGYGGEQLLDCFSTTDDKIRWVAQPEQLGTAHAVNQALPQVPEDNQVLVVYGDIPMISSQTLTSLLQSAQKSLGILTARLDSPKQYGRIIRDRQDRVVDIVEHKEANAEQITIQEINAGFMAAPAGQLKELLSKVKNSNTQQEYYLTDVVRLAVEMGLAVNDVRCNDEWEITGVNTRAELAVLEREYQKRRAVSLADTGVTIMDLSRLDLRGEVQIGKDSLLDVNVVIEGPVSIGEGVHIEPNCFLKDVVIGDHVRINSNSVIEQAVVGNKVLIGPFARIRPGTKIGEGVHIGNFVELKNAELGDGAKVNHLSYVGDSRIGGQTNIGAGVITCNYDGANKHQTQIGSDVFVGSNSQLVAPIKIGDGATVGAGSTITQDVPEGALAVSRAKQRHVPNWQRPKKS